MMRVPVLLAVAILGAGQAEATRAAAPPVVPASDLIIRQSGSAIDWRWRVAPEAAQAPALLAAMRAEALAAAAKDRAAAERDAADARKAGYPFRRHTAIADWSLAADTPHLLALAGRSYAFTGGAHGNTGHAAKLWDKTAGRSMPFAALFTDWGRARALLQPAFCTALAAEQNARGGNPGGDCPSLIDQPIVPSAELASTARQFRVLVAPYVAGSYAEGSYLITLPWPAGIAPLVKPAYRTDLFGTDN